MYLTERLIGVFIYSYILIFMCFIISISKRKYLGVILSCYTCILTIMAFFFVPNPGADLYRLTPIMNNYAQFNIYEFWNTIIKSSTPIAELYLYFIGKLRIDGLLPAVTAYIFFRNVFYIIKKSARKYGVSSKNSALVVFTFMSTGVFLEVISGIRCMLAFSIIAVCMYKEIEEEQPMFKNILWYIIAALLHSAAMALVCFRVIYFVFQHNKNKKIKIISIIMVVTTIIILLPFTDKYLNSMISKAYEYFNKDGYSYIWEYIIGILDLMLIVIVQIVAYKANRNGKANTIPINVLRFSIFISILSCLTFFEYNTFHRLTIFNSMVLIPVLIITLGNKIISRSKRINLVYKILIISCIMLFLACTRGNLSSLKFFIL